MFFVLANQYPVNKGIDSQPDQRYSEELREFHKHLRVLTVEGPYPVEEVIGCCSYTETNRIGDVFRDFDPFLADVSSREINKYPGDTYNPELNEFYKKSLVQKTEHMIEINWCKFNMFFRL